MIEDILKHYWKKEHSDIIKYLTKNISVIQKKLFDIEDKIDIKTDKDLWEKILYPTDDDYIKNVVKENKIKENKIKENIIFAMVLKHVVENIAISKKKLLLKEVDEIKKPTSRISYIVNVGDNSDNEDLFIMYIFVYYMQSLIRKKIYTDKSEKFCNVGIDFEFTQRVIALMQINFENMSSEKISTNSFIWIVNPGLFSESKMKILLMTLMLNDNIYKILHGPDSLDVPYMYTYMFNNDIKQITQFTKKMFDTRYMCEYYRLNQNNTRKCSIYTALHFFDVIDDSILAKLEDINYKMGPPQDVSWDITNLSSYHLNYALYDVLYLDHYIKNIIKKVNQTNIENIYGYRVANDLIRFIYLERNEISGIVEYCKEKVNPMNNYLIKKNGKNYTLVKIFNSVITGLEFKDSNGNKVKYDFISLVKFVSKQFNYVIKFIIFNICQNHFSVYKKKDVKLGKELDHKEFLDTFDKYQYTKIKKLCESIDDVVTVKLLSGDHFK